MLIVILLLIIILLLIRLAYFNYLCEEIIRGNNGVNDKEKINELERNMNESFRDMNTTLWEMMSMINWLVDFLTERKIGND